ncbi:thioesterase II family protein [Anaerocolumna xylanovorans]|uniref:Surfactin synthase thioesterase subunit n=1 Tax=Anaerocolumna xylanovorans DSM 12503 TaxID=1121345 RepID=A0A1M7YI45_9FIRM|nr:thioesterase domain-containing protein [Anaerocolumna xylanovorans]SHO52314.1 Surfactin synthase thioesterase subunit [Anaerocolumna xylanovorans DSM 12503]
MHNKWIAHSRVEDSSVIRLFCFHYAGGSAVYFSKWKEYLNPTIDVCAVQLPMREHRINESMPGSIQEIAHLFVRDTTELFDKPFILFGHSMGAIIAYEVARKLEKLYGKKAQKLIVSGCAAPSCPDHISSKKDVMKMSVEELCLLLRDYGQISAQLMENQDFLDYYIPIIRNDFHLCQQYSLGEVHSVDSPIIALTGDNDPFIKEKEDINEWMNFTNKGFESLSFPGQHFFIDDNAEKILKIISSETIKEHRKKGLDELIHKREIISVD